MNMARGNSRSFRSANKNIQDAAKGIADTMDDLYRSTYMSSPQQGKDLKLLNDKINNSIDRIINKNMETTGMPSVSKLYSRIDQTNKG